MGGLERSYLLLPSLLFDCVNPRAFPVASSLPGAYSLYPKASEAAFPLRLALIFSPVSPQTRPAMEPYLLTD